MQNIVTSQDLCFPVTGTSILAQDVGRSSEVVRGGGASQEGEDEAKRSVIVVGTCSKVLSKGRDWAGGKIEGVKLSTNTFPNS